MTYGGLYFDTCRLADGRHLDEQTRLPPVRDARVLPNRQGSGARRPPSMLDGSSCRSYGQLDVSPSAETSSAQTTPSLGPETLGQALCLLRHRTSLGRDSLASLAELSAGAVSDYEDDVSAPSAVALRCLAAANLPRVVLRHLP